MNVYIFDLFSVSGFQTEGEIQIRQKSILQRSSMRLPIIDDTVADDDMWDTWLANAVPKRRVAHRATVSRAFQELGQAKGPDELSDHAMGRILSSSQIYPRVYFI